MSHTVVDRPPRMFGLFYSRRTRRAPLPNTPDPNPPLEPLLPENTPPQILNSSRHRRSRRRSFTQLTNQIRSIDFFSIISHATTRPRASRARRTSLDLFRLKVRNAHLGHVPVLTKRRNARTHRNNLASIITFLVDARNTVVSRRLARQANDSARRSAARARQSVEERSIAAATDSNSRIAARLSQTTEARSISRVTDSNNRRASRLRSQPVQCAFLHAIESVLQTNTHAGESSRQQPAHPSESSLPHLNGAGISRQSGVPATPSNAQCFRKRVADISWASCSICNTKFPTAASPPEPCGFCAIDRRNKTVVPRFSSANLMDPGLVPLELSRLSPLETLLIARVNPIMSVYRVKGQQYKYSGNVINFMQEVNNVASVLPYKPADLDAILIVSRDGAHTSKEFRVRREFVRQALVWLKANHIHYKYITICDGSLNELPEDGIPAGLPHSSGNVDSTNNQESDPLQDPDLGGPPDPNSVAIHINEFQTVGTMSVMPQPNQQSRIERTLNQAPIVDQTFANLPFTGDVVNEFSNVGYISMAFPVLFPYGNADLRQARLVKIDQTDYFKFLMQFHDGRFAKDTRFRYFAWNSLSRWRAISLGKVYVKNNPMDAALSIEDIQAMVSSGDRRLANRVSFFATSIRGSRSYWFTKLQELTAMVKQLGSPTIFFTLSAADMQWPELFKLLDPLNEMQNMSPPEQRRRRAKLLNENPCIASWFLQARVDLFLDFLIAEFSVVDYWYRYEWQNRGSGHVHGFLWLQDSPDVSRVATSSDDKSKIIEYFDNLISTSNPDATMPIHMGEHPCARVLPMEVDLENDHEDYAALINWVMRHSRCGIYCLRIHKPTKKQVCRFRFPYEITEASHILEEPPNSNMFRFIGHRNDEYVCSHNRVVVQTWRANIDWSAVLSVLTVVNYIAKYAAKCEPTSKSFTETLRDIIHDLRRPCVNAPSAFIRLLITCVSERDVSAQEVCHLLMGYALSRSSRKVILLNVSDDKMLSSTIRRTRCANNEDNIDTDPSFVARYMQRPTVYETTSLYNMAKHHYFLANAWHTSKKATIVRVVPAIDGDIPPNSEKWESFCRQHVILNHHYRSLEEAKGDCEVWSDRYIQLGFANTPPNVLPEPIDDDEDYEDDMDVDHERDMLLREEWMLAALLGPAFVATDNVELGMREMDLIYDWAEGLHRYPNIDTDRRFIQNQLCACGDLGVESLDNTFQVNISDLSGEQRAAHDLVLRSVQEGLPIRMIVCGGAGTGKSTLIKALVHSVTHFFGTRKSVRIMAPTGVAAFNVGGATIHHELAISVDKKSYQQYTPLNGDQSRRMQEDFKDAKLIIIDEYSMVGKLMLAHIDRRFRDIFSKVTELFGNISILLVGDIRQLPPVCDRALYVALEKDSPMQLGGGAAYAGFNKCVTLSHIFRQAGNEQAAYRDALERLSEGLSTRNDWDLFRTRDCSLFSPNEIESFKNALRLFPVKVSADAFNSQRLIDLGKALARISSTNNCDTASNASSDHAKGLVKVLLLSIGARVMLRSNLHTQSGLVNGAMGSVVDIVYGPGCKSPTDMPLAVMVEFDNYTGSPFRPDSMVVPIPPQTSHWKSATGVSCSRTQIPMVLCWAITIHKSQGLTLDKAVVDIGEKESLGLTFVALSRTRKLTDLAFSPMFTFDRLQKIKKCVGLKCRMLEEERLHNMSTTTP